MAINIFHQCLIRPQPFAGSVRFLTVLFTFCSWQPRVNWLRASGRNYFCIYSKCMGFEKLFERGLFCVKSMCFLLGICNPWCVCVCVAENAAALEGEEGCGVLCLLVWPHAAVQVSLPSPPPIFENPLAV